MSYLMCPYVLFLSQSWLQCLIFSNHTSSKNAKNMNFYEHGWLCLSNHGLSLSNLSQKIKGLYTYCSTLTQWYLLSAINWQNLNLTVNLHSLVLWFQINRWQLGKSISNDKMYATSSKSNTTAGENIAYEVNLNFFPFLCTDVIV